MITRDYILTAVRYMVRDVMADYWWMHESEVDWTAVEQSLGEAIDRYLDLEAEDGCVDREHRWALTAVAVSTPSRADIDAIAAQQGHCEGLWRELAFLAIQQEARRECHRLARGWRV